MVDMEVGVNAAGAVSVLLASGHDRVRGVPDIGGCTAVLWTGELVHHVCSVMTCPEGSGGEAGADLLRLVVDYYLGRVVVDADDVLIQYFLKGSAVRFAGLDIAGLNIEVEGYF